MAQWISFREIKSQVNMERILEHYGLLAQAKRKGDELRLHCPFHDDKTPSLTANTKKGGFHCFGCGAKGNIFRFVCMKEEIESGDINQDDRRAALRIADWFGITSSRVSDTTDSVSAEAVSNPPAVDATPVEEPAKRDEEMINPPLKFAFKHLDTEHLYLTEVRGLTQETIAHFGVGYHAGRGIMKGRIVIPIHNEEGELVAYAGRWPGEPSEEEPKYKLPPNFKKHLVVYNLHRAREIAGGQELILCEGFFDVMELYQQGQENAVALMGSSMSEEQAQLILDAVGLEGRITLAFDDDEAGRKGALEALARLAPHVYVKITHLS